MAPPPHGFHCLWIHVILELPASQSSNSNIHPSRWWLSDFLLQKFFLFICYWDISEYIYSSWPARVGMIFEPGEMQRIMIRFCNRGWLDSHGPSGTMLWLKIIIILRLFYYGSEHGQVSRWSGTNRGSLEGSSEFQEMVCFYPAQPDTNGLRRMSTFWYGLKIQEGMETIPFCLS